MKSRGLTWLIVSLIASLAASAQTPPTVAEANRMFNAWKAPVPPRRLVANIHYVGAIGVSSFLITTPAGHILIDTGFEDTVPIIRQSVEQLGFKVTDIKIILSSHAHIDHVGGHALMKKLTGAQIYASAGDAKILESGGADDFIPFPRETILYAPAKVDRIVKDGEKIRLGDTTLTAHLTPGHTQGATTWTMDVIEDGRVQHVLFFSSASINAGTKLTGKDASYPGIADDLAATFAKLKTLPCDIFFAPHGAQFAMAEKIERLDRNAQPNPFIDPEGYRRTIAQMERSFLRNLEREKAAPAGPEPPHRPTVKRFEHGM